MSHCSEPRLRAADTVSMQASQRAGSCFLTTGLMGLEATAFWSFPPTTQGGSSGSRLGERRET